MYDPLTKGFDHEGWRHSEAKGQLQRYLRGELEPPGHLKGPRQPGLLATFQDFFTSYTSLTNFRYHFEVHLMHLGNC